MSVPFEIIECERCDYIQTTLVTAGKFVWTVGTEEFWFDRELGVCVDCQAVVAMEKFPDPALLSAAQKRRNGFWNKLTKRYGNDEAGHLASYAGFSVVESVMSLGRKPVCLSCGGSHVQRLALPDDGESNNTAVCLLHITHPGCGGELTIRGSGGERVAPMEVTRIYDIHGQQISERPGWR